MLVNTVSFQPFNRSSVNVFDRQLPTICDIRLASLDVANQPSLLAIAFSSSARSSPNTERAGRGAPRCR